MQDVQRECLESCLRLFRTLGDAEGVAACLRAIPALDHDARRWPELLTAREREVAGLIALGLSNRAIAETLGIAEGTARRHITNILGKLAFHSRSQIASWFVERR